MPTDYVIPVDNMPKLEARLGKLAKKAEKLGTTPITWEVVGHETRAEGDAGFAVRCAVVRLSGESPAIDGWRFIATIAHAGEAGNMIRTAPDCGDILPVEFRTADPICQHCGLSRKRLDTFVLQNEAKELRQVGRNCLGLFLGGVDPQVIAQGAEVYFDASDAMSFAQEHREAGSGRNWVVAEIYLAFVAASIRVNGWLSRSSCARMANPPLSTSERAALVMGAKGSEKLYFKDDMPTKQDYQTAESAIAWVRETFGTMDVEKRNDYQHNLAVVLYSDEFPVKGMGLAASAVQGWLNYVRLEGERHSEAFRPSKHLGEVGKGLDFHGVVTGSTQIDGRFGISYLYRFQTNDGDVVSWFSYKPIEALESSTGPVAVKARVKKHDEYKGVKQTVITNACVKAIK